MIFITKAQSLNEDYYCNCAITELSRKEISEIKQIQKKLNKHFKDKETIVKLYLKNVEFYYIDDNDEISKKLTGFIKSSDTQRKIFLTEKEKSDLENLWGLDTEEGILPKKVIHVIEVYKDYIILKGYFNTNDEFQSTLILE